MTGIDAIREELNSQARFAGKSAEYIKRYFHEVPPTLSLNRVEFILNMCKDKTVLHLGCAGPLHGLICKVAKTAYGIDRADCEYDHIRMDLEKDPFPKIKDVDIVLCAEVLEHLSNPGMVLDKIRAAFACPMVVTVPNAFADAGSKWMTSGYENVNDEHVCYYSYRTCKTLLERHGWQIAKWYWADGKAHNSETIIFVVT